MVIALESYVFAVADVSGESNEHDYITVQATDLDEAQEKAEQMAKEEYPQWGKVSIECLESESFSADGYKGISAPKIEILEWYVKKGGKAGDFHDLPTDVQIRLQAGNVHELLYQDVNRWLQDKGYNPHMETPDWLSAESFSADNWKEIQNLYEKEGELTEELHDCIDWVEKIGAYQDREEHEGRSYIATDLTRNEYFYSRIETLKKEIEKVQQQIAEAKSKGAESFSADSKCDHSNLIGDVSEVLSWAEYRCLDCGATQYHEFPEMNYENVEALELIDTDHKIRSDFYARLERDYPIPEEWEAESFSAPYPRKTGDYYNRCNDCDGDILEDQYQRETTYTRHYCVDSDRGKSTCGMDEEWEDTEESYAESFSATTFTDECECGIPVDKTDGYPVCDECFLCQCGCDRICLRDFAYCVYCDTCDEKCNESKHGGCKCECAMCGKHFPMEEGEEPVGNTGTNLSWCNLCGENLCVGCYGDKDNQYCEYHTGKERAREDGYSRYMDAESFSADSSERCFACGCAGDEKGDNPGGNELIYCELCEDSWCDCCREPSCADKHEWYFCTRNAAESFSAETIKPMTIGLGLGIVALFLWRRNR